MEIFVTDKFLNEFTSLENDSFKNNDRSKLELCIRIYKLISSGLRINSDISFENLKSRYDPSGNKSYKDIKDIIAALAIKTGNYNCREINLDIVPNYNAYYLFENIFIKGKNSGTIIIDDLKNIVDFYSKCTVNSLEISDDYALIEGAVPPCNSMIIIDKYLFIGEKKLENLIKFINLYKNIELNVPFQLTIISSYDNNNRTISPAIFEKSIQELNKLENFNYEVLLDKNIPIDDRLIYTNYTKGSIGHPFDNRKTVFNQNFLGTSDNIKRDYMDFYQGLDSWKKFCNKVPEKMGIIKTRFSNTNFNNRIFENIVL